MSLPTCTFVKTNGVVCKGLAVKGRDRCHFHQDNAEIAHAIKLATTYRRGDLMKFHLSNTAFCKVPGNNEVFDDTSAALFANLELPPIEDANSINQLINIIVRALTQQAIPARNAGLILYALQIASGNLDRLRAPMPPYDQVSTAPLPPKKDYSEAVMLPPRDKPNY